MESILTPAAGITLPALMIPAEEPLVDGNEAPRVSVPHISFSQMSMYLRCSKQYYYAYTLGLRQPPSLPLAIGSGGHAALEYNGRHKIKTGDDLDTSDLLDMASTFLDLETADLGKDVAPADAKGEAKDRAIAAIRIYRERDAASVHPAGVEVEFNLDLNIDPNVEPIRIINGKIDLITTDAGVEDYKFAGKMKAQNDVDLSPQLTLYGKVFQSLTGKYPAKTGFRVFTPGNTRASPDARVIYRDQSLMTPDAQQRRTMRLINQVRSVEHNIKHARPVPTDDPRVCSWCGFRERCQSSLVDDFEAARIRGEA